MSAFDYDLFVIGAGSGGVRAARIAAGYGARVAVAEEYRIGGTCVIRGCVPKKLYVYASRFRDDFEDAAGFGWTVPPARFDWPTLVAAKEKEISRLSGIYAANLEKAGVEMISSRAVLTGPNAVALSNGRRVSAKVILVATGGSPVMEPAIPGCDFAISSNEIFDLPKFPQRLIVVGGGYIAVEFASVFARLGAQVTQVFRADNILRGFDGDLRTHLSDAMRQAGVALKPGVLPTRIDRAGEAFRVTFSNGEACEADQILVATGRRPHTKGLGLETAGVGMKHDGAVIVDERSCTNVPSIYAVGDVTNRINLTPVAIREGHAFADNVFGGKDMTVDHRNVPSAVFTTPEIGTIGLTEEEARRDHDVVDVYSATFRPMKATLSGRAEKTFMKILVDGRTDRVLGVHLLGHETGEMAQLLAIPVRMGATKSDFDATMALHPTASEELVTMRTRSARHERGSA
ncbi:MAG: glutathione-disulfide reductase [Hyphomicrobiales bacterium]|nr:glutathione-disulfide reductase [Hyphomicrobiales bacterium]